MTEYGPTYNEIDDYVADLTEAEREDLAKADAAIELSFLFHAAREARGLTQMEAAQQAGLRQQAVSRFEQPDMKLANTKIDTLRKYMAALDYVVQIAVKDAKRGVLVKQVNLSSWPDVDVTAVRPAARFVEKQHVREVATGQDNVADATTDLRAALEAFFSGAGFVSGNASPQGSSNDLSFARSESLSFSSAAEAAERDYTENGPDTTAQGAHSVSWSRPKTTVKPKPNPGGAMAQQEPQEPAVAA